MSISNSPFSETDFKNGLDQLSVWIDSVEKTAKSGCSENKVIYKQLLSTFPEIPNPPSDITALFNSVEHIVSEGLVFDKDLLALSKKAAQAFKTYSTKFSSMQAKK